MKTALFLSCILAGGAFMLKKPAAVTKAPVAVAYKPVKAKLNNAPVAPIRIVVDKSNYELQVFDAKGWYATYPVVFGNDPMQDKKMEGDKCTPEGDFKIILKKPHEKWSRFMLIDYPNKQSMEKFTQRKQRGEIPRTAQPGGGVGIHGTWPYEEFVI